MTNKAKINSIIDSLAPSELEHLSRLLAPAVRKSYLKYKDGPTAFLEIPAPIAEGVKVMIRARYPELVLKWEDSMTDFEKDVEARLRRMQSR